jgi:cellulose biosynthesis protein BcsQ
MLDMLTEKLGKEILDTKIPQNNTIKTAPAYGETVFEKMHWGAASQAFGALTEEILERCGNE